MDNHMYIDLMGHIWYYNEGLLYDDTYVINCTMSMPIVGFTLCPPAAWEIWGTPNVRRCTCGASHVRGFHSSWCDIIEKGD